MYCILITAPGEKLEGASELHRLGYSPEPYPCTQDTSSLTDVREEESGLYIRRSPASAERRHVRSLRASFIRMLLDPCYANNDMLIFGESDACPIISADKLQAALKKELEAHPETDIFRLFHNARFSHPGSIPDHEEIGFEDFHTKSSDANNPYVWGTHAMVIPRSKRAKVAQVFADYRLPTDIALEAAHSNGDLNIRVARHNLFYQQGRTRREGDKNIAACLASYKRLTDLQRQIWCMMDQSYPNLHVFAAVKGIPEGTYRRTVLPLFEHFIQEGRLTMRLFPNKNQLSNLLDTVRDIDVSGYDLFAKVDDDDLYGRDYFQTVNEFHKSLPQHFSSYYCGLGGYLHNREGYPIETTGGFWCFGPTMVFSRAVLDKMRACEQTPGHIAEISPRSGHNGYGFTEDNMMHRIMQETGSCNRARMIADRQLPMHLVIQNSNSSVMRGGLVPGDFRGRNGHITAGEEHVERILEVRHPQWHDLIRILGSRARRFERKDGADVLLISDTECILQWDQWKTETFLKGEDGVFTPCTDPVQSAEACRNKKIAVICISPEHRHKQWKRFYTACRQYFLQECDVHYYHVTDNPEIETEENVTIIGTPFFSWPMNVLRRFEPILNISEELESYDYIYLLNDSLLPVKPIGGEILPAASQRLAVVLHPDYYKMPRTTFPYETNGMSEACIWSDEGRYYVSGNMMGGTAQAFLMLCRNLDGALKSDLYNGAMAVNHTESHLNKYILNRRPLILSPEYLFPSEESGLSERLRFLERNAKIMLRPYAEEN